MTRRRRDAKLLTGLAMATAALVSYPVTTSAAGPPKDPGQRGLPPGIRAAPGLRLLPPVLRSPGIPPGRRLQRPEPPGRRIGPGDAIPPGHREDPTDLLETEGLP